MQAGDEEGRGKPEELRREHPFVIHRQYGGKQIPSRTVNDLRDLRGLGTHHEAMKIAFITAFLHQSRFFSASVA